VEDDSFLLLFNACPHDCTFTLPSKRFGTSWEIVIDTAEPDEEPGTRTIGAGDGLELVHRSLVLARRTEA
jgi:isoamylase